MRIDDWPTPDSALLVEILAAFRRRSKAIKHKVTRWSAECDIEEGLERLDIDFCPYGPEIRLSVWQDGCLLVRVCQASKSGWLVNYTVEASVAQASASDIVSATEDTFVVWENKRDVQVRWERLTQKDQGTTSGSR